MPKSRSVFDYAKAERAAHDYAATRFRGVSFGIAEGAMETQAPIILRELALAYAAGYVAGRES